MIEITWRMSGNMSGTTELAMDQLVSLTYEGSEIAATAARKVVENLAEGHPSWREWTDGTGPAVEIVSPPELAGSFEVSVSRVNRRGIEVVGTSARRVEPLDAARAAECHTALAAFTRPEDVENSYELLGNRYGHSIQGAMNDKEDAEIEALIKGYDDAVLHDLGWPVRSKANQRIGFLADTSTWDGSPLPDEDARRKFFAETGCVAQPVSRWSGKDVSFLVAFLPVDRLEDAPSVVSALESLVRPAAEAKL